MNRNIQKIKFLTKLKMSLGIDTRADEINMQLGDLNKEKQKVREKIEVVSIDLSKVDSIIGDIDKIYDIAENDVLQGKADNLSVKIMSYQLSIERANKLNVDISKIVEMKKNYQKLLDECIKEYIDSIINNTLYSDGRYKEIKILINNISNNLNRVNFNSTINRCEDLAKIKQHMMEQRLSLTGIKNYYSNKDSSLRKEIFEVEMSEEKRMADYAVEVANNKKRR